MLLEKHSVAVLAERWVELLDKSLAGLLDQLKVELLADLLVG